MTKEIRTKINELMFWLNSEIINLKHNIDVIHRETEKILSDIWTEIKDQEREQQ